MDTDELRALLAIADHGSLHSAAGHLGWPRATLRRRIEALEARVGVELVTTHPWGAALTTEAHRLVRDGAPILARVDELLRPGGIDPDDRVLRIVMPIGMPAWSTTQVMTALSMVLPDVRIDLRAVENPVSAREDDVDLAVHMGDELPRPDRWITYPLVSAEFVLLAHADLIAEQGPPHTVEALFERYQIIAWTPPSGSGGTLRLRDGSVIRFVPDRSTNDIDLLHHCAAQGTAIAYTPDVRHITEAMPGPPLVRVLEDQVFASLPVRCSMPRRVAEEPALRSLTSALEAIVAWPSLSQPPPTASRPASGSR